MEDPLLKEKEMTDSSKSSQDKVSKVVENAITNFSSIDESFDLKNIVEDYTPLVVNKIFEKSDEVILIDTTNELIGQYSDEISSFSEKKHRVTIYSPEESNPFPEKDKIEFHHLTSDEVKDLYQKNIRNIMIGDKVRFMWEKAEKKPSHNRLKNAWGNLFSKNFNNVTEESITYQSITNFYDEGKVQNLLQIINQVIKNVL